jgi:RNA polymerase subunit RPABC4/transcription elongation factor Spt4
MLEETFGGLTTTIDEFVASDIFQIGLRVLVVYIVLIWLASAFWAYRDLRLRTTSVLAPYVAAAVIIVFTPIFFLFGLLLYRIVRPKETIGEVSQRALTEEAILGEVQSRPHCANCMRPVHEEWIICPTCRNRLRRVCPNCEHLVELDWTLCAWCGKDFERAESPGTAFMPTARRRPAPPLPGQQPTPPRPGLPPTLPPSAPRPTTAATPRSSAPQVPAPASGSQPRPATGER